MKIGEINKTFEITTKLLFGKLFSPLEKYSNWMERRIPKSKNYQSCLSSKEVPIKDYYFFKNIPKNRVATFDELFLTGSKKMDSLDNLNFENLRERIKRIAYFVPDFQEGNNRNVTNSTVYIDCINISNSFDTFWLKNSAYNFSAFGEGLFGCYRIVGSKFSIHCYNVVNLTSCFEMDSAKNCSNSMFCHNVENIHNSLFCFNTKSKRYAIGNIEVGRERYLEIKKMFLERMVLELEKNYFLNLDIYNLL